MKETTAYGIAIITLPLIISGCVYLCTTPEYWYAGMHDGKCEKTHTHGGKCGCYERLIKADKARNGIFIP